MADVPKLANLLKGNPRIVFGKPKGGHLRNKLVADALPYLHSGLIRIVSPKGAVLRESVTQRTGYAGTSG